MAYRFIFFDLETTGTNIREDRIIEIAAFDPERNSTFSELVYPNMPIPKDSSSINGITDDMVAGKAIFQETGKRFFEFATGEVAIVAHNGDGFDFPLLYNECKRHGLTFPQNWLYIDSLQWARKYRKDLPRHALQYLRKIYNVPENTAHRALEDVKTLHAVFMHMVEDLSPEEIYARVGNKNLFAKEQATSPIEKPKHLSHELKFL